LDVLVVNDDSDDASLLFGNGDGSFSVEQRLSSADAPRAAAVEDMDGDGISDMVFANHGCSLSVLLGQGGGSFASEQRFTIGNGHGLSKQLRLSDLNGDGRLDALAVNAFTDSIGVLVGREARPCFADFNGDGTVDTRDVLAFLNAWAAQDASSDCDGNGVIDTRDVLCFLNAWTTGC
jgi:hypothetical protein